MHSLKTKICSSINFIHSVINTNYSVPLFELPLLELQSHQIKDKYLILQSHFTNIVSDVTVSDELNDSHHKLAKSAKIFAKLIHELSHLIESEKQKDTMSHPISFDIYQNRGTNSGKTNTSFDMLSEQIEVVHSRMLILHSLISNNSEFIDKTSAEISNILKWVDEAFDDLNFVWTSTKKLIEEVPVEIKKNDLKDVEQKFTSSPKIIPKSLNWNSETVRTLKSV